MLPGLSAGIFGPLNHKRYFLNVFGAYGEEKTRRALAKMVEDPALLAKALRLRNVRLENRRWRDVLNAAGIEYIINKNIGVNLTYFIQNNWINSKLYPDKTFTTMGLGIGLFLRYKKEKRYYN